jgi:hypothetical protein
MDQWGASQGSPWSFLNCEFCILPSDIFAVLPGHHESRDCDLRPIDLPMSSLYVRSGNDASESAMPPPQRGGFP